MFLGYLWRSTQKQPLFLCLETRGLATNKENHRVVIFLVGAKLAKKPLQPVRILHGFVLHRGESSRTCGVRPERARRLGILGESFEAPLSLDTWVLFKGLAGVGRCSVCCLLCFGAFLLFFGGGWDYPSRKRCGVDGGAVLAERRLMQLQMTAVARNSGGSTWDPWELRLV